MSTQQQPIWMTPDGKMYAAASPLQPYHSQLPYVQADVVAVLGETPMTGEEIFLAVQKQAGNSIYDQVGLAALEAKVGDSQQVSNSTNGDPTNTTAEDTSTAVSVAPPQ